MFSPLSFLLLSSSWRRHVLFHLDLLFFIHQSFVRCLRLQSNTPSTATTRNHGFWTRLSFFSVDVDCVFFFLSASSRAAVDPVVVDCARNVRRFRALHLGRVVNFTLYRRDHHHGSFARNRASLPPKRRRKTPSRRTRRPRRPFSLVFSALSALSALCDCWSSTCFDETPYSRSLPSRSVDLLVHVESRDVPVLLEVQKATKARRRPWYLLPFSLSLSLFRAK